MTLNHFYRYSLLFAIAVIAWIYFTLKIENEKFDEESKFYGTIGLPKVSQSVESKWLGFAGYEVRTEMVVFDTSGGATLIPQYQECKTKIECELIKKQQTLRLKEDYKKLKQSNNSEDFEEFLRSK